MSHLKQVDYFIVGQGLAGSALAVQLLERKKKILVIDRPLPNSSSRVAAGLFNPVTGKYLSKTWKADELFPYLKRFYSRVEHETQERFLHDLPIYIPFQSAAEQNEWMARSADTAMSSVVDRVHTSSQYEQVKDGLGGITLKQSGYLDTNTYLDSVRRWVERDGIYKEEDFVDEDLIVGEDEVTYREFKAKRIVFCRGEKTVACRFFNWLPVVPLKGQTISVKGTFPDNVIINRGVYLVPEGGSARTVGATYEHGFETSDATPEGRKELEGKLEDLINCPYTVIGQNAGLRPTTPNRRPILGAHPEYLPVIIFNGLGTKGVSIAPYFSGVLVRWLENGDRMNVEVDISRYKSLYWKSR